MYIIHKANAVSFNFGLSLDKDGPVSSARARAMPPPITRESNIIPSIIMPIPPSHWVSERQSRIPLGWALIQSTVVPGIQLGLMLCEITVAPVVVNPDIDSNQELTAPRAMSISAASAVNGPTKTPPSQYGNSPMKTTIG